MLGHRLRRLANVYSKYNYKTNNRRKKSSKKTGSLRLLCFKQKETKLCILLTEIIQIWHCLLY